jgi:hypothetical protein
VRFDGFGLYFVDTENHPFGLLSNGKPWYTGLANFEEAVSKIKEKSTVSITRDGFLMNVLDSGKIRLGYSQDKTSHGLWIDANDFNIELSSKIGLSLTYQDSLLNKIILGYNKDAQTAGLWVDSSQSSVSLTSKGFNFNINNGSDILGAISVGYLNTDQSKYGIAVRGRPTIGEGGEVITENYIFKAEVNNISDLDEYLKNPGQASIFGFNINENALYTTWYQEWLIGGQTFHKTNNLFYIHRPPAKNYGNVSNLSYDKTTQFPDQVVMCLENTYTADSPIAANKRVIAFQLDTLNGLYSNQAFISKLYLYDYENHAYYQVFLSNRNLQVGPVITEYDPDGLNPEPPIDYTK